MLIQGEIRCERCISLIKWEHATHDNGFGLISVQKLSNDRQRLASVHLYGSNAYILEVYCKECGKMNSFEYKTDLIL